MRIAAYKAFRHHHHAASRVTALRQGTVDGQEEPAARHHLIKFRPLKHSRSPTMALALHLPGEQGRVRQNTMATSGVSYRRKAPDQRARVDEDDAKGVADLRAKGMAVIDNLDKSSSPRSPGERAVPKEFSRANWTGSATTSNALVLLAATARSCAAGF